MEFLKPKTSCETLCFFLNNAMFWRCFWKTIDFDVFDDVLQNAKHRANDASNDVNRPPLAVSKQASWQLFRYSLPRWDNFQLLSPSPWPFPLGWPPLHRQTPLHHLFVLCKHFHPVKEGSHCFVKSFHKILQRSRPIMVRWQSLHWLTIAWPAHASYTPTHAKMFTWKKIYKWFATSFHRIHKLLLALNIFIIQYFLSRVDIEQCQISKRAGPAAYWASHCIAAKGTK